MKPVKILHIASGDLWAGAEMQMFTLACACQKNHAISAVLFNEGKLADSLRQKGIDVWVLDESQYGFIALIKQMISILQEVRPDITHTHGYKQNVVGSMASLYCGIPSIRTVHGDSEFNVRMWSLKESLPAIMNRLCGRFIQKAIVAVSGDLSSKLVRNYPKKKVCLIPNGINIQKIKSSAEPATRLPGKESTFKIAYVGRLMKLKRVDLIVDAFECLADGNGDVYSLFIVGDGPEKDLIETKIQSSARKTDIHLLGHRDDVHAVMGQMDCLVIASDHEGLPMTVLEAIALKVSVVSHAVGAIPEVLDYGQCGYLINEQSAEAFATAIKQCDKDPNRKHKTNLAYQRVEQHYSDNKNASSYLELYQSILV